MKLFKKDDRLIRVIEENHHLLPVLNRFGIRLGFGDATIDEICSTHQINSHFFLDILNAFHHPGYFPKAELLTFSPSLIVEYLQKTHQYYLGYVVPHIENLLDRLIKSCLPEKNEIELARIFFIKYKNELIAHIADEDETVFPYILRLTSTYETGINKLTVSDKATTINTYKKEHSNVEEKLNDLKNLIIKFIKPTYDDNLCNEFLMALFRFERDLADHARVEDKILVPMIQKIEKKVRP